MEDRSGGDFVDVSINVKGMLRISKNSSLSRAQIEDLALSHFRDLLAQSHSYGETIESSYSFHGEVNQRTSITGHRDPRIEVRHDRALSVSGGGVAIAPADGTYGANRLRGCITAYVAPDGAYITARDPLNDSERVICMVNVSEGDITCHVMEPGDNDAFSAESVPGISVTFPNLCISLN